MSILARFKAINDNYKAGVVRKLMEYSTPDFAFFYFVGLSVMMATLGLLLDSASVVIGSMLIAPILYPILGTALGLVMSNGDVIARSVQTLLKAFAIGLGLSILLTIMFGGDISSNQQIISRIEPSLMHVMVAVVAGLAVSFALAQPEWSETLPGIAISVALIPPLAVLGIGLAKLDMEVIGGSAVLLIANLIGIIFAAMLSFSLMNLYEKQHIAESTIKREDEKIKEEQAAIQEVVNGEKVKHEHSTITTKKI